MYAAVEKQCSNGVTSVVHMLAVEWQDYKKDWCSPREMPIFPYSYNFLLLYV